MCPLSSKGEKSLAVRNTHITETEKLLLGQTTPRQRGTRASHLLRAGGGVGVKVSASAVWFTTSQF